MRSGTALLVLAAVAAGSALGQPAATPHLMSHAEAKPVLDALRDHLPQPFAGKTSDDIERAWPSWAAQHDAEIRARIARGDEDSLVNFWLYGTSFTAQPRALVRDIAERGDSTVADVLAERANDLARTILSPGTDERLQFARSVVERAGIDLARADAAARVRRYLTGLRDRALREYGGYDRFVQSSNASKDPSAEIAAFATIFKDRGLSSDTSLLPDFAIDRAFAQMQSSGDLAPGSVRRVAIVGPGLDFTNKADGYDFYPQQTIQPVAIIDSLFRRTLARPGQLTLTTFDLNPRVNAHLAKARQRAAAGVPYTITLPLSRSESWTPEVERYWKAFGDDVGVPGAASISNDADVRVRTVRVRPEVVSRIAPLDLNVVVERLELPDASRFDLVVATNIFVYYDLFDQSLAVANVAAMLRPGGFLLSNNAVYPIAPLEAAAHYLPLAYSDRQRDYVVWYRRR